jgi:hypothetical protein
MLGRERCESLNIDNCHVSVVIGTTIQALECLCKVVYLPAIRRSIDLLPTNRRIRSPRHGGRSTLCRRQARTVHGRVAYTKKIKGRVAAAAGRR